MGLLTTQLAATASTVLGLLCAAVLGLAAPAVAASPTITEYGPLGLGHPPTAITAASDGNLWFIESGVNTLGIATVTGSVSQYSGLRSPAQGIASGPDGNLWITEPGSAFIARLTMSRALTEFPLASGSKPNTITTGPDGNLWFTETGNGGAIGRISTSGVVTQFNSGLTTNSQPTSITAGPDGNLWFTESNGTGAIGRITTSGTITEFTAGLQTNGQPSSITAGPDGNLWFTESNGAGAIGRISTTGTVTLFTTGLTANMQPTSITAGPDGNLWFTEAANPGMIGEVTVAGTITQMVTPTPSSQPGPITVGPDGNVWFMEAANHVKLGCVTLPQVSGGPPSLMSEAPREIRSTSATLYGLVDPQGAATTYHFEWGQTSLYDQTVPVPDRDAGSDTSLHAVSQTVTGLLPNTVYHYRLVATNASGVSNGSDMTFVTDGPQSPPAVSTQPAAEIGVTTANMYAVIDPEGTDTTYHFDWGQTAAYGQSAPAVDADLGSDISLHAVRRPSRGCGRTPRTTTGWWRPMRPERATARTGRSGPGPPRAPRRSAPRRPRTSGRPPPH